MADSLTEPLIAQENSDLKDSAIERSIEGKIGEEKGNSAWLLTELQMLFWLACPMVGVNLLQYAVNLVSIMFVGHLGELELASAAVATSFAGVTGFSLLIGMGSALETLCGQAYGAKQDHLVGIYMQRAIIVLNLTSIPVCFIWLNVDPLLRLMGQDHEISHYAGLYSKCMLPTLFAYATLQPMVKFLQAQSAVLAMAYSSALTLGLHVLSCWLLIYKFGFGFRGAALANGTSQWINVLLLVIYIKFSPKFRKTWTGFSAEAFHDLKAFFKLAIPSAVMICLEYWSFELVVLMSGLLPNPQLEMSTLSLCLNTIALLYMVPMGLAAAVSTRVSNELGAGKASAAKRAVAVGCTVGCLAGLISSSIAFSARDSWPYLFTNVPEVAAYVAELMPFLAFLTIMDSTQGVLCGVMRGCGNQEYGAYTNLGAYYIVGVPLALTLAFHFHLNGRGLWLGMIAALTIQAISLGTITLFTNWEKQAQDALERVFADRLPTDEIGVDKDESKSRLIQQ